MFFQLVIPCYNESRSLRAMIERTVQAAKKAGFSAERFQLIIVDNGSTDETQAVIGEQQNGEFAGWFSSVTIDQNLGYGDGIKKGLEASTAEYIGWTHADEQCDPADAFTALARLLQSPAPAKTLVKGRRAGRKLGDYLWSRCFESFAWLGLGVYLYETNAQPKVFARLLLKELPHPPQDFAFDLYVLYKARRAGWDIDTIPVVFAPRAHGVSHWAFSARSRIRTALRMMRSVLRLRSQRD